MTVVWVLVVAGLVVALVLVTRRLSAARDRSARLDGRLAAVLEGQAAGIAVWDADGRLVAVNGRFREFYPGVPLKPGLIFEDLLRFTVTRGLVQMPEDETEAWVQGRLNAFGAVGHDVLRTADGRWLELRHQRTDDGEVLLVYTDVTSARERELAATEQRTRSEQHQIETELVDNLIDIGQHAASVEAATQQAIDAVCAWSGWPLGFAYYRSEGDPSTPMLMGAWARSSPPAFNRLREALAQTADGLAVRALGSADVVWIAHIDVDPTIAADHKTLMPSIRGACAVPVRHADQVVVVVEFLATDQMGRDQSTTRVLRVVAQSLAQVVGRHAVDARASGQPWLP